MQAAEVGPETPEEATTFCTAILGSEDLLALVIGALDDAEPLIRLLGCCHPVRRTAVAVLEARWLLYRARDVALPRGQVDAHPTFVANLPGGGFAVVNWLRYATSWPLRAPSWAH